MTKHIDSRDITWDKDGYVLEQIRFSEDHDVAIQLTGERSDISDPAVRYENFYTDLDGYYDGYRWKLDGSLDEENWYELVDSGSVLRHNFNHGPVSFDVKKYIRGRLHVNRSQFLLGSFRQHYKGTK